MWPNNGRCFLFFLTCFGLSAVSVSGQPAALPPAECTVEQAQFLTDQGLLGIAIEIADDPAERERGLMYRKELPAGQGMLFIYDTPRPVSFWMRNTLIPLDLVFMDVTGTIRHIHPNARPLDETPLPGAAVGDPDPNRLMVLEIGGGEAARLGLKPGQPMAHPRLDPRLAIWPCS